MLEKLQVDLFKTDIFSMGITLLETAFGMKQRQVFKGLKMVEFMGKSEIFIDNKDSLYVVN